VQLLDYIYLFYYTFGMRKYLFASLALCATAALAQAPGGTSLFDNAHPFLCSKGREQSPSLADYFGCEFKGQLGEEWHPLFPVHAAKGDHTCRIAYRKQAQDNCITCFPTPATCRTTNEAAALPSADTAATAEPGQGKSNSFTARVELIERATLSIRMQYFIFYGDESGWALAELLKKKKKESPWMNIQVITDLTNSDFVNFTVGAPNPLKRSTAQMYFDLQQHGIPVYGYEANGEAFKDEISTGVRSREILGHVASLKYPREIWNYLKTVAKSLDARWHDKMLVVDAESPDYGYAIVGGQNIANEYFRIGGVPAETWRDEDVLLRGPIVRDVAKSFDNNATHLQKLIDYNRGVTQKVASSQENGTLRIRTEGGPGTPGYVDADEVWKGVQDEIRGYFARQEQRARRDRNHAQARYHSLAWHLLQTIVKPEQEKVLKHAQLTGPDVSFVQEEDYNYFFRNGPIQEAWLWDGKPRSAQVRARFNPPVLRASVKKVVDDLVATTVSNIKRGQGLVERLRWHPADMRWFNSHPRYGETYIAQAYVDLIKKSKRSIDLINAYFIPDPEFFDKDFLRELKAAARRCVDVRIFTNSRDASENTPVHVIGRSYYRDMLEVNTEELKARCGGDRLRIYEWHGERHGESTLHSKYAIFDRREALVGSFNLDPRSTWINSETAVVLRSPSYAAELLEQLEKRDLPKFDLVTAGEAEEWHQPMGRKAKIELLLFNAVRPSL
jgi:phosphatidylserine/phosphatidylglycerophosphate/cardiolipin synthase-like enzyme